MFLPEKFVKVERIDYSFTEQKIPFVLNERVPVNTLDNVNKFLANDDDIIQSYFNGKYPFGCRDISVMAKNKMSKYGISAEVVHSNVYTRDDYNSDFPFDYIHDLKHWRFRPLTSKIQDDIMHQTHYYVLSKVENNGIVNEFVFDYTADQFVREETPRILREPTTAPVIGPRDELRGRYIALNTRRPHTISPGCIGCR